MPNIAILNQETIDKIAAGEVVERPCSVVKELVENAIDAGSTAITVEIKEGGISFIRITDNGCGIERDQVAVAFYRHSTSKIRSAEDLLTVKSLGFRGEALSSISAVARVELITKTYDELTGTRYVIEGSKELSNEEIGAPDGTTFIVKDLFYNVPARRKFLKTAQTEGSYISDMVPDYYVRKQTLTNAERYITPELKELEDTILGAEDRLTSLEYELFRDVRKQISCNVSRIQKTARAIAQIDVFASLALVASQNNYCKPKINESGIIDIKNGRHPVVEKMITNDMFIENDTYLDQHKNRISIITGPNMAGKSTYMRQTALIVLMAQIGSFVPAQTANIGIVDRIFTRVGASDDLASGQSTFMVEMNEVANILRNATAKSLNQQRFCGCIS